MMVLTAQLIQIHMHEDETRIVGEMKLNDAYPALHLAYRAAHKHTHTHKHTQHSTISQISVIGLICLVVFMVD